MSERNREKLSKWKKSLFNVFILIESTSAPYRSLFSSFKLICLALEQANTISILIFSASSVKGFSSTSYLVSIFKISRLDILIISYSTDLLFAFFFISTVLLNILLKLVLIFEAFYDKKFMKNAFAVVARLTNFLIFSALKIPVLNFCLQALFTTFQIHEIPEYKGELLKEQNEARIAIGCFGFLFIGMIGIEVVLGNIPKYKHTSLSRAYGLIHIKELFVVIFLLCSKIIVNTELFIIIAIFLSCYQFYLFYNYLPFFNTLLNLVYMQTWASLAALGILEFISILYQNFFIVELVYPFIFASLIVLNIEVLRRKIEKHKSNENFDDPYYSELNLRYRLFDSSENCENRIKEHYKISTENYFLFKIQYIWESLAINRYSKNKCLALMKLSKVNLSQLNQSQINNRMDISKEFEYSINLEVEFLTYHFFNKLVNKIPDISRDIILISYSKSFTKFNETEKKLLKKLKNFSYSIYEQNSSKSFNKRINTIGNYIRNYFKKSKKMIKKFGNAKKFIKQHQSFCKDILKIEFIKEKKNKTSSEKARFKFCQQFSKIDEIGAFIIVSGEINDFGKIIFANKPARQLIKVNSISEIVGKSLGKFMPKPFDVISNKSLVRFIMYGDLTYLEMNRQFILDSNGCYVETSITIRMSFYEDKTYFILNFTQVLPLQAFIVSSKEGIIVGISLKLRDYINSKSENLFLTLPNIKNYIERFKENIVFYYEENNIRLFIKYKLVNIAKNDLIVIYVIDEHSGDVIAMNYEVFKGDGLNFPVEMNGFEQNALANSRVSDNLDILEKSKIWEKYLKASIRLRKLLKFLFIVQIIIMLALLIAVYKVVGIANFNFIIFDTGLMRYLSTSTLSNIYSLDLMHQNYPVAFTEDFYRAGINENMDKLQYFLKEYNEITLPFSGELKEYFNHKKLSVSYETINSTYEEIDYLTNIINVLITDSRKIANTSLENFSSINNKKIFLYKNIPNYYTDALNSTIFGIMNDLIHSLESIFKYEQGLELISIIIPGLLLILSSFTLIQIENGNQLLWKKINNITTVSLNTYTQNLVQRLKNLHFIDEEQEKFSHKLLKKNSNFIVLIPFCKVFFFLMISIGFYLTINLYNQNLINEVIKQDLVHMNFGGLRRMMTPLTLFWARNSALESNNKDSYKDWFQHSLVGNSNKKFESLLESYKETQESLMMSLTKYPLNQFKFEKYLKLMYGDSCELIANVNNCSSTYVSHGLDLALQFYIQELRNFRNTQDEKNLLAQMINVEKYSKLIEKSFVSGLFIYANYTDKIIIEIKYDLELTIIYYCLATVVYFLLILRLLSEQLNILVENKILVASLFN